MLIKKSGITEEIGWYGVTAILVAYGATNLGWLVIGSVVYKLLNLTGAMALIVDSLPERNWQVIALNAVWAGVAVLSLIR